MNIPIMHRIQNKPKLLLSFALTLLISSHTYTQHLPGQKAQQGKRDSLPGNPADTVLLKKAGPAGFTATTDFRAAVADTLPLDQTRLLPYSYTGQFLQGYIPGATVLSASGEPGVAPVTLLRGLLQPVTRPGDMYANQPLYVVNGIPLIPNNHPYQLAIKDYDFTSIGSGIDISALVDMNNIENITVIQGPEAVARFGPHAAAGAVVLETRRPEPGKYHIGFDLYGGLSLPPAINSKNGLKAVNAAFEKNLELPFYQKYATPAEWANFPAYLTDSSSPLYYGTADWNDNYYRTAISHGAGLHIRGGGKSAVFLFGIGEHTEQGVADRTELKRYNVYYDMILTPFNNFTIRSFVQAALADKNRNRSLRDRFSEQEYFPDQEYPLAPTQAGLVPYYQQLAMINDQNQINAIQGLLQLQYSPLPGLNIHSHFSVDYNDNERNYFVPASLNDGNSFNSYYSGVNQRILLDNFMTYESKSKSALVQFKLGQSLEYNQMKYDYIKGYRGPSDYIKIIQVNDGNITHYKKLVYAYKDYLNQNIPAFYGQAGFRYHDKYSAQLSVRSDGSSFFANGYHWAVSPSLLLSWDIGKETGLQSAWLSQLLLTATAGRSSTTPVEDTYSYGPYFTVDAGWPGNPKISTYASFPTLSQPYTDGYTGGGIQRPYIDQWELRLQSTLWDILRLSASYYQRTTRDLMIKIPSEAEYGYTGIWKSGMDVAGRGAALSLSGQFRLGRGLQLASSVLVQYDQNTLKALPGHLRALTYNGHRLEVGKSTDQFWLLQNKGIYEKEEDIPVSPEGKKLSYNGVPFHRGDPVWEDRNHDYVINDQDRVLEGHALAPALASWNNQLQFGQWTVGFSLIYAGGSHLINQVMANRLDFANRQGADGPDGIKELTFWQIKGNPAAYPMYNPWSTVNPYQAEQTLFYERSNYLKLQSATLTYSLSRLHFFKEKKFSQLSLYLTGVNLWTLTPYKGLDPSLRTYSGYDSGDYQPQPICFTFGIHADF